MSRKRLPAEQQVSIRTACDGSAHSEVPSNDRGEVSTGNERLFVDGREVGPLLLAGTVLTRPRRGVTSVLEAPVGSFRKWDLTVGSQLSVVASHEVAA